MPLGHWRLWARLLNFYSSPLESPMDVFPPTPSPVPTWISAVYFSCPAASIWLHLRLRLTSTTCFSTTCFYGLPLRPASTACLYGLSLPPASTPTACLYVYGLPLQPDSTAFLHHTVVIRHRHRPFPVQAEHLSLSLLYVIYVSMFPSSSFMFLKINFPFSFQLCS
jgi:hypothetical protein